MKNLLIGYMIICFYYGCFAMDNYPLPPNPILERKTRSESDVVDKVSSPNKRSPLLDRIEHRGSLNEIDLAKKVLEVQKLQKRQSSQLRLLAELDSDTISKPRSQSEAGLDLSGNNKS